MFTGKHSNKNILVYALIVISSVIKPSNGLFHLMDSINNKKKLHYPFSLFLVSYTWTPFGELVNIGDITKRSSLDISRIHLLKSLVLS